MENARQISPQKNWKKSPLNVATTEPVRVYLTEAENIYLVFCDISPCVNLDKIMLKLLSVQFESIEAWPER